MLFHVFFFFSFFWSFSVFFGFCRHSMPKNISYWASKRALKLWILFSYNFCFSFDATQFFRIFIGLQSASFTCILDAIVKQSNQVASERQQSHQNTGARIHNTVFFFFEYRWRCRCRIVWIPTIDRYQSPNIKTHKKIQINRLHDDRKEERFTWTFS